MDPAPTALVALAILGFVPGVLLYWAINPKGSKLEAAAIAPTLSFAFVFLFGEVTSALPVPFAPLPFLAVVGIVALVAARRWYGHPQPHSASTVTVPSLPATLLLLGGIALATGSWLLGIHGVGSTPPYTDSANHGLMAAQVADRESLDTRRVLASDPSGLSADPGETAYYPLALHGEVALANRLFGTSFADGLLAATLLFSAVVLPLGLFVAVRQLVPDTPLLAGLTALLGGTTAFFPVLPLSFGGLPLVIGTAMVPAVAAVSGRYLARGGGLAEGALGAIGAVGILATHTSEIPLLALFVLPMVADQILRRRQRISVVLRRGAFFGLIAAVLTAPTLPLIASGTAERSAIDEGDVASFRQAFSILRSVIGGGSADLVAILAVAGILLCLRRRQYLAPVATTAGILALYTIACGVDGPFRAVTVPWYQHPGRIALNLVLLIPFFAAFALTELVPAIWARRPVRTNSLVPVLALASALAIAGFSTATKHIRVLFMERVLVGPDAQSAFAYLKAHVAPGERVLNDGNTDGAMWMYPFDGVVPLLGLHPANPGPSWHDRVWLIKHLTDLGSDPNVRGGLDRYSVRFIYWNDRNFVDNPHHIDGRALAQNPYLCERFQQGSVRVLEVSVHPTCT